MVKAVCFVMFPQVLILNNLTLRRNWESREATGRLRVAEINCLSTATLGEASCVLGEQHRLKPVLLKAKRQQDAGVTVATQNIT
jgi:hypothetical protein